MSGLRTEGRGTRRGCVKAQQLLDFEISTVVAGHYPFDSLFLAIFFKKEGCDKSDYTIFLSF